MRACLALFVLLVWATDALAGEIRRSATKEVRPNSIWFQDAAKLTRWQELKTSGDVSALPSYEKSVLGKREAWQFSSPLKVKILGYAPKAKRVYVEMKSPGRMESTKWFLDDRALVQ